MNKMKAAYGGHMIDIIFTLALFCVFAASALFVVLIGANVYKTTAASMGENFDTRTSVTYIATKIRQNDTSGGVYIAQLDNHDALVLEQDIAGETYQTWIYQFNGELCEIFALKDSGVRINEGQSIMPVKSLKMEQDGGMLKFTSVGEDGRSVSVSVAPRCAGGDTA